MTSSTIRPATLDDVPGLVALLAEFVEVSGYGELAPYDPDTAAETCRGLIQAPTAAVFVAVGGGDLVGAIGGVTAPAHWNRQLMTAAEVFWWVRPGRRDGAGQALRRELQGWFSEMGGGAFFMSCLDNGTPAVDRVYRRAGMRPAERLYVALV